MEIIEIIQNNIWSAADGKHNDLPLKLRFRREVMEKPDTSEYPKLVRLYWVYEGLDDGLPGNMDLEQMNIFENDISRMVEHDASAILVAVITNDGQREWIFYARDMQNFAERLMNLKQDNYYPVELTSRSDPEWNFLYQELLIGLA